MSSKAPDWGVLVTTARERWRSRFLDNAKNYRSVLAGEVEFPLTLPLKPPKSAKDILAHTAHFQAFYQQWQALERSLANTACEVVWELKRFQSVAEQRLPVRLVVHDAAGLMRFIGSSAYQQWQSSERLLHTVVTGIGATDSVSLRTTLIKHLATLEAMSEDKLRLLLGVLPQLQAQMGRGEYLRALPVVGVDTKFIEQHGYLLEAILDVLHEGAISAAGGLSSWLACLEKPRDWLLVRPLCPKPLAALAGMSILRLSTETLWHMPLPAHNILIIENEQSCLALSHIPETIAVAGGGKNLSWLGAEWLADKRVAYWGDIDSEGFAMLSQARTKVPQLKALMMDAATVERFAERMVEEPHSVFKAPECLLEAEQHLFQNLRRGVYQQGRLEQERLDSDYIQQQVLAWAVAEE